MGTKSKHHVSLDGKRQSDPDPEKRRREKRRSSRNDGKKDHSAMQSIRKSLRNKFQRIKGSSGRKLSTSNGSMGSSMTAEDKIEVHPSVRSTPKAIGRPPTPKKEKQQVSIVKNEKTAQTTARRSTPKNSRDASKEKKREASKVTKRDASKEKRREASKEKKRDASKEEKFPHMEQLTRKEQEKQKTNSNSMLPNSDYGLNPRRHKSKSKHKKKNVIKSDPSQVEKEFRSFSDSSDYSDTDFESYRSNESDASSVYSDPGYNEISSSDSDPESDSNSESDLDSESSHSESSDSYSTEDDVRMMVKRSAVHRNPETGRGRSRKPRRKQTSKSNHIRSPRTSPRKSNTEHIQSPRKSSQSNGKSRFFPDDEVDDDVSQSDDSSYITESSFDSSESDSGASNSSGSSYSDSESDPNDEYYTTSYDSYSGNINDSTFSGSWTDRPLSTNGSEETERTHHTNQNLRKRYPTLNEKLSGHSTDGSDQYSENQKLTNELGDLGSIAETEYNATVKEQEIAGKEEKRKDELQEQQQHSSGGGIFAWIFGGPTIATETTSLPEPLKIDERHERKSGSTKARTKHKKKKGKNSRENKKGNDKKGNDKLLSPPESPGTTRSEQPVKAPLSPFLSPRSPQSAASSRNDFIVRDRRSALFTDDDIGDGQDEVDPTMSPGCVVNLNEMLSGGDSMPGSYGGLQEGEFLVSTLQSKSSTKNNSSASTGSQSVTMRGSASFEEHGKSDAPNEISFESRFPSDMSSPRADPLDTVEERDTESSLLYCCFSPTNDVKEDSERMERDFSRMVDSRNRSTAFNFHDSVASTLAVQEDGENDENTCASTINTEGIQDLSSKTTDQTKKYSKPEDGEKNLKYLMIPVDTNDDLKEGDGEERAEEIEIELGSYHGDPGSSSSSEETTDDADIKLLENDNSVNRMKKAEDLEGYDVSEIVHGRRAYKSKTDDDGLPIQLSRSSSQPGKRERRKNAMKAHRDFIYKSHSIDTNADSIKVDDVANKPHSNDTNADSTKPDDVANAQKSGSPALVEVEDGAKNLEKVELSCSDTSTEGPSTSTEGPSVLSNSIVHDDVSCPNDDEKPDALMELVRNAFQVMMLSPASKHSTNSTTPVDSGADAAAPNGATTNDTTTNGTTTNGTTTNGTTPNVTQANDNNTTSLLSSPMDDMIDVAFRFFGPKQETASVQGVQRGQKETLQVIHFDSSGDVKDSDESSTMGSKDPTPTEEDSLSFDATNPSDEAVTRDSPHKSPSKHNVSTDAIRDESRFNADGIPLELRPKKIWRVFDSGISAPASVATDPSAATRNLESTVSPESAASDGNNATKSKHDAVPLEEETSTEQPEQTGKDQSDANDTGGAGEECDVNENSECPGSLLDHGSTKAKPNEPKVEPQPLRIDTDLEQRGAKQELDHPDFGPLDLSPLDLSPPDLSPNDRSPRLSTSARFRRRNGMKKLRKNRFHQEAESPKEPETAVRGREETTGGLPSPRAERDESYGKHSVRTSASSLSPKKRSVLPHYRETGENRGGHASFSKDSLVKQRFFKPAAKSTPDATTVAPVEDRDATTVDDHDDGGDAEKHKIERAPPSPLTTPSPPEDENGTESEEPPPPPPLSPNSQNDALAKNNKISVVRSRIKERRKTKLRKQQQEVKQQEQALTPRQTEDKQDEEEPRQEGQRRHHLDPAQQQNAPDLHAVASGRADVRRRRASGAAAVEDRADAPASPAIVSVKNDDDEFFDALTFEDSKDDERETAANAMTEIEVTSPLKKYMESPVRSHHDRDRFDYLSLSHKESILSGVMSLD
eukprot:CAMPEP_0197178210 /NCGR_PEP_ID=MMETSP1423-20130617/3571_1 /TAXON_ID=476441 /ORGANISM="Pseudo-nitzschia heimii, Strain UNC1101" /LENGTH=1791 /DNA_ID=CAMNT_0042627913 /DNA_START=221 /DNA_END=5596 /DNA_ORIENTATION=+